VLKTSDNPLQRYPEDRSIERDSGNWYVAHTKSRQEKALARDLTGLEIGYYLPMTEKRVRRRDNNKIRKSQIVLFPNYVSVAIYSDEAFEKIYATRRVVKIIPVTFQDQFVSDLQQVAQVLNAGSEVEFVHTFQPGEKVNIIDGPMMGLSGTVNRNKGKTSFVIRVEMFQQAVSVEVDEMYLETVIS